jgi:hypothetical protein
MRCHSSERSWLHLRSHQSSVGGWLISSAAHRARVSCRSFSMKLFCGAFLAAVSVASALGQSNLGSIQGTVVGSDGTPLPGAHVYAGVVASGQKAKSPPTLMESVQAGAIAQGSLKNPANTFLISRLEAGTYVLCSETNTPGWLDPCHWSASVPSINLAAGQNLTAQTVVMTKGAIIQIRLVDPSKMLSAIPGPIPRDIEIVAHASNNAYYNAQLTSTDVIGQYRQLTLPFDQVHTLVVRSQQFSLLDATGAVVPTTGHTQQLQVSSTAVAPQLTYTVAGKAH